MEEDMTEQVQHVHRVAQELFEKATDWVTFFREVLGVNGVIRQQFKTTDEMADFEQTEAYMQIQHMLARLRAKNGDQADSGKEPTRVITVRLPQSLHESLRAEAHDRHTSMNKLCISKLLQMVERELVPVEA
jgi:predicted HicB family RNase H-like nuclease